MIFGIYYSIGKIGADLAESVDFIGLDRFARMWHARFRLKSPAFLPLNNSSHYYFGSHTMPGYYKYHRLFLCLALIAAAAVQVQGVAY
ncbi:MAG: hypothetical protein WBP02_00730, partial [Gammaproteobacteria bacterium]